MWHQPPRQQQQQEKQQRKQQQQQQQEKQQRKQQQQQQQQSRRHKKQQQQLLQHRVLWLWCHASYYKHVHDVIQSTISSSSTAPHAAAAAAAAASSEAVTSAVTCAGVTVQSLSSSLRRVELLGPSADLVLKTALQQQQQGLAVAATAEAAAAAAANNVSPNSSSSRALPHNEVWAALAAAPLSAWQDLPHGCVLGLAALDPRLAEPLKHSGVFEVPEGLYRDTAAGAAGRGSAAGAAAASGASVAAAGKALQQLLGCWPYNGEHAACMHTKWCCV
jgi:hypothetical protein